MGAEGGFERRKKELAIIQGKKEEEITDDEVRPRLAVSKIRGIDHRIASRKRPLHAAQNHNECAPTPNKLDPSSLWSQIQPQTNLLLPVFASPYMSRNGHVAGSQPHVPESAKVTTEASLQGADRVASGKRSRPFRTQITPL